MRTSTFGALLLPAIAHAFSAPHIPGYAPFTTIDLPSSATPEPPSPNSPPPKSPNPYFPAKIVPPSLNDFIHNLEQSPLIEYAQLEHRQNGGAVGGGPPGAAPLPPPTQVSPITTIYLNGQMVVYTQTFAAVPDQMATAVSGSVGMGTLTGSVGVVKTNEAHSGRSRAVQLRGGWRWVLGAAVMAGGGLLL